MANPLLISSAIESAISPTSLSQRAMSYAKLGKVYFKNACTSAIIYLLFFSVKFLACKNTGVTTSALITLASAVPWVCVIFCM